MVLIREIGNSRKDPKWQNKLLMWYIWESYIFQIKNYQADEVQEVGIGDNEISPIFRRGQSSFGETRRS